MTFTITMLTVIKFLAICFCLIFGGGFTYLFWIGMMVGEGQKVLLISLLSITIGIMLYSVYFIATYNT